MSNVEVFGDTYAVLYDQVYTDKGYDRECTIIRQIIDTHGLPRSKRLLDLGCGTGSHAIRLAADGLSVTGVDRSTQMLAQARTKAEQAGVELSLHPGDLRTWTLDEKFDAAIMMFAVLGYQHNNEDVCAALERARAHIFDGGLLIFDLWYGPAVLGLRPEMRFRRFDHHGTTILRASNASLDTRAHVSNVFIQLWQLRGDTVESHVEETHRVRFFFPLEIDLFLKTAGFELVGLHSFPDVEKPPSDDTWNVLVVARASDRTG